MRIVSVYIVCASFSNYSIFQIQFLLITENTKSYVHNCCNRFLMYSCILNWSRLCIIVYNTQAPPVVDIQHWWLGTLKVRHVCRHPRDAPFIKPIGSVNDSALHRAAQDHRQRQGQCSTYGGTRLSAASGTVPYVRRHKTIGSVMDSALHRAAKDYWQRQGQCTTYGRT